MSDIKSNYERIIKDNPFKPLSEAIAEALRNEIVYFKIQPGTRIVETDIADSLNVSRTVVASAIEYLQSHELVRKEKAHSPYVAPFSWNDYNNLIKFRNTMESMAAEQMAPLAVPEDISILDKLSDEMYEYINNKDYTNFVKKDFEYHKYIVKQSKNNYLYHTYNQMRYRIQQYMFIQAPFAIDKNPDFKTTHYSMTAAIARGNPDFAKLNASIHCSGVYLSEKEIYEGYEYAISRQSTL